MVPVACIITLKRYVDKR